MKPLCWMIVLCVVAAVSADQATPVAPDTLPAAATRKLSASLNAAKAHGSHVWRDASPINADGTINGYIEIARGDRRKWELDMSKNARVVDRMIPESIGGYPINYGFVPQTVSYDGDPFDVLVLGPPIDGGSTVRGLPVGVMLMEDGGIIDSKVIVSPLDANGRPAYQLTDAIKEELTNFFNIYKQDEPGASTRVPGWGTAEQGIELIRITHAFFNECGRQAGTTCRVSPPKGLN